MTAIALSPETAAAFAKPFTRAGDALFNRADLALALDVVKRVIEKKAHVEILTDVCIRADGRGGATVIGTDLDLEVAVTVPGAVDSHFALCVPAHMLETLTKKAPKSEHVALAAPATEIAGPAGKSYEKAAAAARIDFERVNYGLVAHVPNDFPALSKPAERAFFQMPAAQLLEALESVEMAISTEETRYYLNGIYVHVTSDNRLAFVATDGHRLMRKLVDLPAGAETMPGVILPRKTVEFLTWLLSRKGAAEMVAVSASDTRMEFMHGNVRALTKLIDGTFPDYQRVIPSSNDKVAVFETAALLECLNSVALVQSQHGRAVKFEFEAGAVMLTVTNPDVGDARARMACAYDSAEIAIGWNSDYLRTFAKLCGDTMRLVMGDAGDPALILSDDPDWTGVLMPMRV